MPAFLGIQDANIRRIFFLENQNCQSGYILSTIRQSGALSNAENGIILNLITDFNGKESDWFV